jgi:hypothetical protein
MNKEQASWLIVRAFGVYLLIQAFILGLGILGQVYAVSTYNRLASSVGTDSNYITPILLTYRSTLPAWLLKFVLYLAAGTYLLRRGRFLMRWLQHVPDAPRHDTKASLTEGEASEMSVKERLSAAGLFQEFAHAVERRDVPELERILRQIYLTPDDIQTVIAQMLGALP